MTAEMKTVEARISSLFDELVPATGKAATVAGEIIRAISRIEYRRWNDGDRIGVGYGKETCNPAARYLSARAGSNAAEIISQIWGMEDDDAYETGVQSLEQAIVDYLDQNPELMHTANTEDMFDYRNTDEDIDDSEDEEW